jgi:hypothetical protein
LRRNLQPELQVACRQQDHAQSLAAEEGMMWSLFTVPGISPNGKSMDFSMSGLTCVTSGACHLFFVQPWWFYCA